MARIRVPAGRPGRITVGDAAVAFDPISGDGVGHALRGAVLAATMLQTIAGGAPVAPCLARYSEMLRRAMSHHLRICLGFYRDGAIESGWRSEVAAMEAAVPTLA